MKTEKGSVKDMKNVTLHAEQYLNLPASSNVFKVFPILIFLQHFFCTEFVAERLTRQQLHRKQKLPKKRSNI